MKKFCLALLLSGVMCAIFLAGCRGCVVDLNGNDRSGVYYYAPHTDATCYYYNLSLPGSGGTAGSEYIRVDRATGESSFFVNESGVDGYIPGEPFESTEPQTWEREVGNATYAYEIPTPPVILDCKTNGWRGYVTVSRENFKIYENLTAKYQTKGVSFIHACLLDSGDGTAYGFVNVYDHTTGLLFGAGVAGVSGISYGVFIKYAISTGVTEELLRADGGCITAFDKDTVLFFKDKKYYSQNIGGEPVFAVDDGVYDRGITGYSHSFMLFNGEHFVLYMHSDNGKRAVNYAYVFGSDGKLISSCTSQEP